MLYDLGITDYQDALRLQHEVVNLVNSGVKKDTIIFVEHTDVYTAGKHTLQEHMINGALRVERGGSITYHGPGQIVVYFIINLKTNKMTILDLINSIHGGLCELLRSYGMRPDSKLGEETGVWIENRKIASTGLAVREFASFHGTALNVSTNLDKFNSINPCGFSPEIMTSMEKEIGKTVSLETVKSQLRTIFSRIFPGVMEEVKA